MSMSKNPPFTWSDEPSSHLARRKQILVEHPEVRELFGIDPTLKYKSILVVLLHLAMPFVLPSNPWLCALFVYFVGATLSHYTFLSVHEVTHDLAFRKRSHNNILALILNFPIVLPYAIAFRTYHSKHHAQQGVDGIDTDIPSEFEREHFQGPLKKAIWMLNQGIFYGIRPVLVLPIKPTLWQLLNVLTQVTFLFCYYQLVGWQGILYLLASGVIASSIHPLAGHFISEHYVMDKGGQETTSYYGPLNLVLHNVGYHTEHHDFPNIPGSRLPQLKKLAPKHYDSLHSHSSLVKVLYQFIFSKEIGLHSRVKRTKK